MATLETVHDSAVAQDIHEADLHADASQCPYCGQPISRKQYREIRERIEGQERARIAKVEQTLKDRFAREKERAETEAVNAEKVKLFAEKLKLEEKLQEMQRALQKRSAAELGEEGEVDLFEALKTAFPGDRISRVAK